MRPCYHLEGCLPLSCSRQASDYYWSAWQLLMQLSAVLTAKGQRVNVSTRAHHALWLQFRMAPMQPQPFKQKVQQHATTTVLSPVDFFSAVFGQGQQHLHCPLVRQPLLRGLPQRLSGSDPMQLAHTHAALASHPAAMTCTHCCNRHHMCWSRNVHVASSSFRHTK